MPAITANRLAFGYKSEPDSVQGVQVASASALSLYSTSKESSSDIYSRRITVSIVQCFDALMFRWLAQGSANQPAIQPIAAVKKRWSVVDSTSLPLPLPLPLR